MIFNLREIHFDDSPILFDWANDAVARSNSFNEKQIELEEHEQYIKNMIVNPLTTQYILEIDGIPVGTIKDKILNDCIQLGYEISPQHRNKGLSVILMNLYLYERRGKFLCEIKSTNIPSIKMVQRCGYTLQKEINGVCYYVLHR